LIPDDVRPIPEFPNYGVRPNGEVWRIARDLHSRGHLGRMKFSHSTQGYANVTLYADGRRVSKLVHILVARAFLGPCPEGMEVSHSDNNKMNPALSNLSYVTHAENEQHKVRCGRGTVGEQHPWSRLTDEKVREIRSLHAGGARPTDISVRFGVHIGTISDVVHRKTWRHVA